MLRVMSAPHCGGQVELGRHVIERDHVGRALRARARDHAQSDRTAAGDHDDVAEADGCPLDGVQCAGQRFGERRVRGRDVGGHLVHDGVGGIDHVFRHRPVHGAAKPEDAVRRAHPVLAAPAEPALPARHDLLGHDAVAGVHTPPLPAEIVDGDDLADEFVAGDDQQIDVGRDGPVAPVHGCPVVALEVARADPDGLHLHQRFARSRSRHGNLLESVVLAAVDHHRLHRRVHPNLLFVYVGVCCLALMRGRVLVSAAAGRGVVVVQGPGEIDGGAHRHLRAGYVGREQGSLVLNGGGTPLQSGGQCLAAALRAAEIAGEHGVACADGTDDPVDRRVTPHGPCGVDENRAVAAETGQHGAGTATAYFLGGVDDLAEGLRYPAGQFGEFVHVGLHQIWLCRAGFRPVASPEVSTATGTPLRWSEFDDFAVPAGGHARRAGCLRRPASVRRQIWAATACQQAVGLLRRSAAGPPR